MTTLLWKLISVLLQLVSTFHNSCFDPKYYSSSVYIWLIENSPVSITALVWKHKRRIENKLLSRIYLTLIITTKLSKGSQILAGYLIYAASTVFLCYFKVKI